MPFIVATMVMLSTAGAQPCLAQVAFDYRQDAQHRTVSLSRLSDEKGCYASAFVGRIVKRDFRDDGLEVSGFVYEDSDGRRQFVNVDVSSATLSMVARDILLDGLQRLTKIGRIAQGRFAGCGASGRVVILTAIN